MPLLFFRSYRLLPPFFARRAEVAYATFNHKKKGKIMSVSQDIYTRVTQRIIEQLEEGTRPWLKPWSTTHLEGRISLPIRHNGERYHGLNVLLLWDAVIHQGYTSNQWMTYKQAKDLGGHILKGERGQQVVYANKMVKTSEDHEGNTLEQVIPYLKTYTVFNVEQIEGLSEAFYNKPEAVDSDVTKNAQLERFFTGTGAIIRNGGNQAYYTPKHDFIKMPYIECFKDTQSYYATLSHELTHWTKHPSRLARDFGGKRFGDNGYAMEELVAELGSAFLCAHLGTTPEVQSNHSEYLDHWLKILRTDKRAIFTAASHAQKAVDCVLKSQQRRKGSRLRRCVVNPSW